MVNCRGNTINELVETRILTLLGVHSHRIGWSAPTRCGAKSGDQGIEEPRSRTQLRKLFISCKHPKRCDPADCGCFRFERQRAREGWMLFYSVERHRYSSEEAERRARADFSLIACAVYAWIASNEA